MAGSESTSRNAHLHFVLGLVLQRNTAKWAGSELVAMRGFLHSVSFLHSPALMLGDVSLVTAGTVNPLRDHPPGTGKPVLHPDFSPGKAHSSAGHLLRAGMPQNTRVCPRGLPLQDSEVTVTIRGHERLEDRTGPAPYLARNSLPTVRSLPKGYHLLPARESPRWGSRATFFSPLFAGFHSLCC